MKKSLWTWTILFIVALCGGACDSANEVPREPSFRGCRQYTSCAACTPVVGCGWCYLADGTGRCADDPNDCADSPVFTWTWDPTGCYVVADAGVVPTEAAEETTPLDTSIAEGLDTWPDDGSPSPEDTSLH